MELSEKQLAYLKSLDSKKKKRKFLLDCLIENVESPRIEMRFSYEQKPFFLDEVVNSKKKCALCSIYDTIEGSNKCESCHSFVKHSIENDPFFQKFSNPKPNYSPEEIELVKHNINQREVTEQGSELLKFDILEDEFWKTQKENERLKKKINQQNVILDEFDIQEDKDIKSHEYSNSIINFGKLIVKCVNMKSDPTNILNQFLLSVNKYYYYKTKNTIDFIDELFPQLKNNENAKYKQKSSDNFFKEIDDKWTCLKSDLKKVVSDFETKHNGLKVLIDIDKIGCLVEEKLFDEFNQSAK